MNRGGPVNRGAEPMTADDLLARIDSTTEQWDTWDGRSADAARWRPPEVQPPVGRAGLRAVDQAYVDALAVAFARITEAVRPAAQAMAEIEQAQQQRAKHQPPMARGSERTGSRSTRATVAPAPTYVGRAVSRVTTPQSANAPTAGTPRRTASCCASGLQPNGLRILLQQLVMRPTATYARSTG